MATRTSTTRTMSSLREQSADTTVAGTKPAPFAFADLVQAYFDCRKSKRNSRTALLFEQNLERNLSQLYNELINGKYQIGRSICFVITHPKPREVWAAEFRDRIVHHLLYNHIAPAIERRFIADSCACIKERGTLYAAKRLESKVRSATQNWAQNQYYLKCDLSNFFVKIDKSILGKLLAKHISEQWWLDLALSILNHDPRKNYSLQCSQSTLAKVPVHKQLTNQHSNFGLPIGNLSSQFFANIYLNELDQFIKHQIKATHYIRYVDDFVILHESAKWLNQAKLMINRFLQDQLGAELNPKKTILQPVNRGIDFVGQVIKPWHRTTRKKTLATALQRVKTTPDQTLHRTANSYFGLLRQASHSFQNRKQLAKTLMLRGKCINQAITKTWRKK